MYCANCGTQLVPGLSYCNRCGVNLRERTETNNRSLYAFLIAITVIGVTGMGILIGGSVTLRTEAGFTQDMIGIFMLFTFLIVSTIELLLFRNLSRITSSKEKEHQTPMLPPPVHHDLRLPQHSTLGEPVPSVTENTTRTLEYERREQGRR